ncbi:hypothetical protein NP493_391g01034 [Ridgeia piscesae]|uniref:Uncharacterized protein n=1 Tax=Ridgeia piscesae TaxID=27915 RepID=A0AAD9L1Z6_RIDPI|nr:hypothetical protein NP493_391g01034 [Ridgeia piscesae]
MRSTSLLVVLTSVLAVTAAGSLSQPESVACPSAGKLPCRCWQTNEMLLQFDCNNLALTTAPAHLPTTTVVLTIEDNSLSFIEDNAFRNLHKLLKLDLGNNKIRHISSDAFKLLPQLTEIDLTGNPLQCDCEMKRLRDWVLRGSGNLFLVGPKCYNLGQRNIFRVGDDEFGNCTEEKRQKCLMCAGFTSQTECATYGQYQTCSKGVDVCETTIQTSEGHQVITKQCQQSSRCLSKLKANPVNCSDDSASSRCQFCCASATCNSNMDYLGYFFTVIFNVSFVLTRPYMEGYDDSTNLEFERFRADANKSLTYFFTRLVSGEKHVVYQTRFSRDPSQMVRYECLLKTLSPLRQSAETLREKLLEVWHSTATPEIELDSMVITVHPGLAQCPRQVVVNTPGVPGVLVWPLTQAGTIAQVPCPMSSEGRREVNDEMNVPRDETNDALVYATRKCERAAGGSPRWNQPDMSKCRTKQLKELVRTPITEGTAEGVLKLLATVTNTSGDLNEEDIVYSAQILSNVLGSNTKLKTASAAAVVHTYNNLLQVDIVTLSKSQRTSNATEKLLRGLEKMATAVVLPPIGQITFVHSQIAIVILQIASVGVTDGVRFVARKGNLLQQGVELQTNTTMTSSQDPQSGIYLPGYMLRDASFDVLQFIVFDTDKLFKAIRMAVDGATTGASASGVATTYSRVIAASFGAVKFTGLRQPVSITLPHRRQTQQNTAGQPVCVFWDFTAGDGRGNWSTRGCTAHNDTENSTTCLCDHLTNFALLLDVYDKGSRLTPEHQMALSVISYVGCGISLVAISLTLFTLLVVKKLYRTENPSKILTHLCCALIGVLVLFIVGTQSFVRNHTLTCQVFAGALHYFVLATWLWMAVEAFYMYHALVKVFQTYYSHFLLKSMLIAWGLPLVAVAITAGVSTDNYQLQGNICWLSRDAFYAGLLVPIAVIIIANCVVFVLVMRQLHSAARRKLTQSQHTHAAIHLQRAASVMILLGLTWTFAFFAIGGANIAFQYLFAVFNSLQGLFIFIFYCASRKDVQQAWKEMLTRSKKATTSSSSSKGTSGQTTSSQLVTSRFRAVGHAVVAARHMRGNIEHRYAVRSVPSDEQPTMNHVDSRV